MTPSMTWICCTWNRPKLLVQLIEQFRCQDYDPSRLELLIVDDAGQYDAQFGQLDPAGKRFQIVTFKRPLVTLGDKYNAALAMVATDAVVVTEDDDLFAPQHTLAHAAVIAGGFQVSKPSRVNVEYGGQQKVESDPGRFHSSLAMRTDFVRSIGGWPTNPRADFDLQMISRLRTLARPPEGIRQVVGDPCVFIHDPTYTFRWETTGHTHAQAYGRGPDDEHWLERARAAAGPIVRVRGPIVPDAVLL